MIIRAGFLVLASFTSASFAKVTLEKLAEGFKRPVDLQAAPGNESQLFIVEQHGVITAIDRETGEREGVLLDLSAQVSRQMNEEGLLGLAFDPNFEKSRRFYVNFTDKSPKKAMTRISRFTLPPGKKSIDAANEEVLLKYRQDFRNHNGGWIGFGPDGLLYIANGDGGARDDPKARAQDLGSYLGKLLRIDVSSDSGYTVPPTNPFIEKADAKPEIYSYGLRNPWRCSFDVETGNLWIADVGQNRFEEINVTSVQGARAKNFGWRLREGMIANPNKKIAGPQPPDAVEPIYQYGRGTGAGEGFSVTGGFVYRGANPLLQGKYLFSDYVTRRLWTLDQSKGYAFEDITDKVLGKNQKLGPVASFGQDLQREYYLVDHSGIIWRIK